MTASVAGRLTNRVAKSLDKSQMVKVSHGKLYRRNINEAKRLNGLTLIN